MTAIPMLTQHARLSAEITALDREISAISTDREHAESERREALERLLHARAEAERPLLRDIRDAEERRRRAETDPAVTKILAEVADAERRMASLNRRDAAAMERRRALVAERAALSVPVDEILSVQTQLDQARASVNDLQARLEEVQRRPPPERPDLDALERRRAAVMADREIGAATAGDLTAIEKAHANLLKEDAKAVEEIQRAELLARGLDERLSEARARLADLERDHRTLIAGYARSQFEQAVRDYHDLATRTFGAHGRLTALAGLVQRLDPELSRELARDYGGLLRSDGSLTAANEVRLIDDRAHRANAIAGVVEELRQAGIQVQAA